jgi:hypothetical protein
LRKRGVKIITTPHGESLTTEYPELVGYGKEIDKIINQGK